MGFSHFRADDTQLPSNTSAATAIVAPSYPSPPPTSRRSVARSRPFFCTVYRRVGRRNLPGTPSRCPLAIDEPDGRACRVGLSHLRVRKTGPAFPLAVFRCRVHGIAFTVYPPEFGPYLRQPVVTLEPIADTTGDDELSKFGGTIFAAALDAARGKAWCRDSDLAGTDVPDRWWSTQTRKIGFATRLLGIASDVTDDVRERIAERLGVPMTRLIDLGRDATGYRALGEAVVAVLRQLRRSASLSWRLLTCAWLVGRFGRPIRIGDGGTLAAPPFSPAMPRGP